MAVKKRGVSGGKYKAGKSGSGGSVAPDRKPLKPSVSKGPKKLAGGAAGKLKSATLKHRAV